jgi:hypothetical protein
MPDPLNLSPVPPRIQQEYAGQDLERWFRQLRAFLLAHLPAAPTLQSTLTGPFALAAGASGAAASAIAPASGLFNFQFSLQAQNTSTAADTLTVWLRVNGTDIPNSAGVATVHPKHGSTPGALVFGWNFLQRLAKGDTVELLWSTASGTSTLLTYPAGVGPASPAVIFTLTLADA